MAAIQEGVSGGYSSVIVRLRIFRDARQHRNRIFSMRPSECRNIFVTFRPARSWPGVGAFFDQGFVARATTVKFSVSAANCPLSTALFDHYIAATGVDGICCDTACPLSVMQRIAKTGTVVQGNLDPLLLASGGAALDQRIDDICAAMTGLPFVFNLGHARGWAYRDRDGFRKLIDILTDASIE